MWGDLRARKGILFRECQRTGYKRGSWVSARRQKGRHSDTEPIAVRDSGACTLSTLGSHKGFPESAARAPPGAVWLYQPLEGVGEEGPRSRGGRRRALGLGVGTE